MDSNSQTFLNAHLAAHQRLEKRLLKPIPNETALTHIGILHFQGIKALEIADIPLDTRWIFLTGENAFGKTAVLRAIAKGLVGDEDYVTPLPPQAKIFINAFVQNQPYHYIAQSKSKPVLKIPVATYGVSRFRLLSAEREVSERSQQITYSLFHENGELMNIERLLIDTERDDKPFFNQLKKIFKTILPSLADLQSVKVQKTRKIRYQEQNEAGQCYEPVFLDDLAAGYRGILTMIGDMMMRLSDDKTNLDDLSGIVLIDEIDAHLHPKYQYELPKLLSDVFPKVQFIVTTHSPIPILGLPADNKPVILTVERNPEQGITVHRMDATIDIRKLNPEALLTSPIFNFQNLFARGAQASDVMPTSDYKEVLEMDALKLRLKKLRAQGFVK
jgi:predicted ATP-binding protein involved in virulence